jgi:hypothetical protein
VARVGLVVRLAVAARVVRPAIRMDLLRPRAVQNVLVQARLLCLITARLAAETVVAEPEHEVALVVGRDAHHELCHLPSH